MTKITIEIDDLVISFGSKSGSMFGLIGRAMSVVLMNSKNDGNGWIIDINDIAELMQGFVHDPVIDNRVEFIFKLISELQNSQTKEGLHEMIDEYYDKK